MGRRTIAYFSRLKDARAAREVARLGCTTIRLTGHIRQMEVCGNPAKARRTTRGANKNSRAADSAVVWAAVERSPQAPERQCEPQCHGGVPFLQSTVAVWNSLSWERGLQSTSGDG
jgi:hypothetical protein